MANKFLHHNFCKLVLCHSKPNMRITALFLFTFFSYGLIQAQDISGIVVDTTGQPIPFATVTLKKTLDSTLAKITVADTTGAYRFSAVATGHYYMVVAAVGYFALTTASIELKDGPVLLRPITLRFEGVLQAVQVTG